MNHANMIDIRVYSYEWTRNDRAGIVTTKNDQLILISHNIIIILGVLRERWIIINSFRYVECWIKFCSFVRKRRPNLLKRLDRCQIMQYRPGGDGWRWWRRWRRNGMMPLPLFFLHIQRRRRWKSLCRHRRWCRSGFSHN